jgi:hypothetical protein
MAQAPDDVVDRLYGLPHDAFVAERDAQVKELRAAGRRDEAAAVKALAKPTVAAWAVNQAVRSQARAAAGLWKAGNALAAAQDAVLAGKGSGADLRAATERERGALDPLVEAARGLLSSSGGDLSETTIERVRDTLHAAAIDAEARADVAAGRATRERVPQGLFGGAEVVAPARGRGRARKEPVAEPKEPAARGRKRDAAAGGTRDKAAAARERERAAERRREEAESRRGERERAAARKREHKAASDRVARAERALAEAEERSAKAQERLAEAHKREQDAAEALAEARAELEALAD